MACQSHCHLQSDPLVFDADNSQVFFDDSNGYLVIYKLGVFTVTAVQARHIPAQTIDFIRRGAVLGVRFSLDKRHVCIQRSTTDVDFVSLQDSTEVAYQCRDVGKGNMIHGFVWCNTALCDLCLVTEMGLELLQLSPKLDGVKLVKHEKRAIDWFHYYHPCRALLLCSGKDHSCLQPFQLLPDKLLKFPDFDPAVAIGPGGVRSRLEQHSITLCKLYDKLCCVYVFAMRQELVVYQLGKEAIGKLCTVNLFSACDSFAVSVCDNLLVVHNTDSRITMIFDIWLQQWSSHPVSAPLPLGGPSTQEPVDTECHAAADEHGSPFTADAYVEEWRWAFPNFIIDKKCGKMWSLEVNLEYLCVSSSDKVNLLRCLLKREKGQAHVLELMRTSIREREALYTLYQLMSIVVEGSRQASLPPAPKASKWWFYDPEDAGPGGSTPTAVSAKDLTADSWGRGRAGVGAAIALEQRDIHQEVLVRVWKDGGLEEDYMIAVTTEYLRSLSASGQMAEPFLVEFLLELMTGSSPPRYHVLHQLLQYHVIQDSMWVAMQLLELQPFYAPALQLALDMIHRLGMAQKVAEVLLAHDKLIQAMTYIKEHRQVMIPAAKLLDAARRTRDNQTFFVTYRFVQEQHSQLFALHHRASPDFVAADKCQHHIEFFQRTFGLSESPNK